jgi:hypothetical protein
MAEIASIARRFVVKIRRLAIPETRFARAFYLKNGWSIEFVPCN